MRQLQGYPATIVETMIRVELAKAGISLFQTLDAKDSPMNPFLFGGMQFADGQIALFTRQDKSWQMRCSVVTTELHDVLNPPQPGESGKRVFLGGPMSRFEIPSQERLNDIVRSLIEHYGDPVDSSELYRLQEKGQARWDVFGESFANENVLALPDETVQSTCKKEMWVLRAYGRVKKDNVEAVLADLAAIQVAEDTLDDLNNGLMYEERQTLRKELDADCRKIRASLVAYCRTQSEQLDRLLEGLRPNDELRCRTLAELDWLLLQRSILCSALKWTKELSAVKKKAEVVRLELFAEYLREFHASVILPDFKVLEHPRSTADSERPVRLKAPYRPLHAAIVAARMATLCRCMAQRAAATFYDDASARLRRELDADQKRRIDETLESRPFGIEW